MNTSTIQERRDIRVFQDGGRRLYFWLVLIIAVSLGVVDKLRKPS